jgi:hypothetical protein
MTYWVGYKVHLTETCEPEQPHLITHVLTTKATTQDYEVATPIQADLAQKALLPSEHLLDAGYVDAELLVASQNHYQVTVTGPVWDIALSRLSAQEATLWVQARQAEMASSHLRQRFRQVRLLFPRSQPLPKVVREAVLYLFHNRKRMDYAAYRLAGFPIGSGTIESACKTVVQARMRLVGMRWSRAGATAMLTLRSLSLSDRWHELLGFPLILAYFLGCTRCQKCQLTDSKIRTYYVLLFRSARHYPGQHNRPTFPPITIATGDVHHAIYAALVSNNDASKPYYPVWRRVGQPAGG